MLHFAVESANLKKYNFILLSFKFKPVIFPVLIKRIEVGAACLNSTESAKQACFCPVRA